jgi:hypothetical protein
MYEWKSLLDINAGVDPLTGDEVSMRDVK